MALGDDGGELAQRLAHEPRLHAHLRVAHFAFELGARHQRRHRVDDEDVHGARADEDLGDFKGLLAAVGLRNQQVVGVYAQLARVGGVERVLGVDEGGHAAAALRLGDDVESQCGLARRFRPEDLDDPAARHAADTERRVEGERAGWNGRYLHLLPGSKAHDGTLAELLVDLGEGGLNGLGALVLRILGHSNLLVWVYCQPT